MPSAFQVVAKRPSATLTLFCFPYAGAMGFPFQTWPARVPSFVEIQSAQLAGHGARMREPLQCGLSEMVDDLFEALSSRLDRPFVFFGHSMGALLAFELARQLRRHQRPLPRVLMVSACCAPELRDRLPRVYDLPDAEFVEEIGRLNGIPTEVLHEPELLAAMLPILRADMTATQTYVCQDEDPLDCPIVCFGGTDDTSIEEETLDAWRRHTTAPFSRQMFCGDHFYTRTAESVLLPVVCQHLESVQRQHGHALVHSS